MKYNLISRLKSRKGWNSIREKLLHEAGMRSYSSIALGKKGSDTRMADSVKRAAMESTGVSKVAVGANMMTTYTAKADGIQILFRGRQIPESRASLVAPHEFRYYGGYSMLPCSTRSFASSSDSQSSGQTQQQQHRKDISTTDDPFDPLTYNIPEKPVTFVEGASYSVFILAGISFGAAAVYFAFKGLLFEPKEYKVFGKALERVQNESQVRARIGSPIKGYGQETRNRAARQQIPNTNWIDEDGVEHVGVSFVIRGPHGTGNVFAEMFRDKVDKEWKYTYLIVEIKTPSPVQLILESYVPA